MHITIYNEQQYNYIIKDIRNDFFNTERIKYYCVYKNKNINPNWIFIYLQTPKYPYRYKTLYNNCLCLFYRHNSQDIIDYINKFHKIEENGKLNNICSSKMNSKLEYIEFIDLIDIKIKSIEFYYETDENSEEKKDIEKSDDKEKEKENNEENNKENNEENDEEQEKISSSEEPIKDETSLNNSINDINKTSKNKGGRQIHITIYDDNTLNKVLNRIHELYNNKSSYSITYYKVYKDIYTKNWTYIYFQTENFRLSQKINNCLYLFYRGKTTDIKRYLDNKTLITIEQKGKFDNTITSPKMNYSDYEDFLKIYDLIKKSYDYYINIFLQQNPSFNKFKLNTIKQFNNPDILIDDWMNFYKPETKDVKILWVWGQDELSRIKKIKEYINEHSEFYGNTINSIYYDGLNWNGIGTAQIAIYNNFRTKHLNYYEMLNFIDNEIHELRTKDGNVKNNYKLIIFNTVEKPKYIYENIDFIRKLNELYDKLQIIECN